MKKATEIKKDSNLTVITKDDRHGLIYVEPKNLMEEETLVAKITTIKDYTEKFLLQSSIELGAYLTQAKGIMKHGQWGNWLKERVDFSQRTANNLMAVYEKYGQGELLNSQAISNMSLTQAIRLLAMPDDQMEEFIEKNNALELSTRELEKKLKDMSEQKTLQDQTVNELKVKEKSLTGENDTKQKEIDSLKASINELEEKQKIAEESKNVEVKKLTEEALASEKEKLLEMENDKAKLEKDLFDMKQEIDKAVKEAEEKTRTGMEKAHETEMKKIQSQLETAIQETKQANEKATQAEKYYKVSTDLQKFSILTEQIESSFNEITKLLISLEKNDSENGTKLKGSFEKVLESMSAKLKLAVAVPQKKIS